MKPLVDTPPRTMMEVYKMLPEGTLAELIDNVLYMSPSPVTRHQAVLNEINVQLYQHLKKEALGMVYIAPLDVYLNETQNAVQPDIIVLLNDSLSYQHDDGHIHGVPDLLFEILSPGNRDHDLILKKALYQQFGVKEYWVVDPETKLCLGFELSAGRYKPLSEANGIIDSALLNKRFLF